MSKTSKTTSGIQIDTDLIGEWVGLHYGRNFDAGSAEKKQAWIDRYAESHGLQAPFLNIAQIACLESYAGGAFTYLRDIESKVELDAHLDDCGDSLLSFLMNELSTSEDCDSNETAISLISTAIKDLDAVRKAIEELPQDEEAPGTPRG